MSANLIHERKSNHPYSHYWARKDDDISLCKRLEDLLPHGSGVNGPWSIHAKKNKRFYASNAFESMNENGYYCHVYSFTAVYEYNGVNASKSCEYCAGTGKRFIEELAATRKEDFYVTYVNVCKDKSIHFTHDGEAYTPCWVCHGAGETPLPEFSLVRVSYHGKRERACCGFGIHDYLSEILYLSPEN